MKKILIGALIVILAIQFIPVNRKNPEVSGEITDPGEIKSIFKKSCYDCHSNETVWPWYSYIAPVSFFIAGDVNEGREHLNFSEWEGLTELQKKDLAREIWEEIEEGEMPLGIYLLLHSDAELSDEERQRIKDWSKNF